MNAREDRWFVRFRGHTLGPLTTEQVRSSLRRRELGPQDKIASTKNPAWRPLEEIPDLFAYWENENGTKKLAALPSPQYLWKKKKIQQAPEAPPLPAQALPVPDRELASLPEEPVAALANPPAMPAVAPPQAPIPEARAKSDSKERAKRKPRKKKQQPVPVAADPLRREAEGDPKPDLAKDTLALLQSLKSLSEEAAKPELESALPARPEIPSWIPPATDPDRNRPKRIELRLDVSRTFLAFTLAVLLMVMGGIYLFGPEKMRGLESFSLPDPSSPTIQPAAEGDPIPSLKAPTRPNRD